MRVDRMLARLELIEASRPSVDYCATNQIDFAASIPACGGVFLCSVRVDGQRFEASPDGQMAAWVDVFDEDGETVIDVTAWAIDRPERWWSLCGVAPALGMAVAANPATCSLGFPLRLFRSPLGWLQAGCDGAVILDPLAGARWALDLPAPRIAAEDDAHAREIMRARQALTERQTIVVPQGKRQQNREAA